MGTGGESGGSTQAWLVRFVIFLLASQLALVFIDQLTLVLGETRAVRMLVRTGMYAASLVMLFVIPRRRPRHPATWAALGVFWIVGISLFHPTTNTVLSGTAQAVLYVAILAPLFWVPRLGVDLNTFRRVVLILWAFHATSSVLGVLQVSIPGFFQPSLSSVIVSFGEDYVDSLRITTASGMRVFRPMGLTDVPGGAAMSGFYAVLFGTGLMLSTRRRWLQASCVASLGAGMMVIYLSQVRSILVLAVLSLLVFATVLMVRGQMAKFSLLAAVTGIVLVGGFAGAVAIGGQGVTSRLATFVEDRPTDVYQSNRGRFLQETVEELLPAYPLGAGLGRWGMMNTYFGDNSVPERANIWVEIQWTGWLLDGGVPLILTYVAALLLACLVAWRIARLPPAGGGELPVWGALLLAYNIGVLAVTFNTPFFIGQGGMEFWVLNGALFGAATARRKARQTVGQPVRSVSVPIPMAGRPGQVLHTSPDTA